MARLIAELIKMVLVILWGFVEVTIMIVGALLKLVGEWVDRRRQ
jgi:hypothetical protein